MTDMMVQDGKTSHVEEGKGLLRGNMLSFTRSLQSPLMQSDSDVKCNTTCIISTDQQGAALLVARINR